MVPYSIATESALHSDDLEPQTGVPARVRERDRARMQSDDRSVPNPMGTAALGHHHPTLKLQKWARNATHLRPAYTAERPRMAAIKVVLCPQNKNSESPPQVVDGLVFFFPEFLTNDDESILRSGLRRFVVRSFVRSLGLLLPVVLVMMIWRVMK